MVDIYSFTYLKSELAFNKSKRAFESELENYSRLQKEVSEKIRKTTPPNQVESKNPFMSDSEVK